MKPDFRRPHSLKKKTICTRKSTTCVLCSNMKDLTEFATSFEYDI